MPWKRDFPHILRLVRVLRLKVRLAGGINTPLLLLSFILRFVLILLFWFAENGWMYAVPPFGGIGVHPLFSAFLYFLKPLRYLFTANFSVRFISPSTVSSKK
jgi:hypothetical protein